MSLFPALPIHNWSNRPAASAVPAGASIRIIDVGLPCGIVMTSDGTNWLAAGQQELARSSVAVSVTGTTTETLLATVTIPAGVMSPSAGLVVKTRWAMPTSANNKIVKHRLGGLTGSTQGTTTYTTNTFAQLETAIRNRNSAASQYNVTAGTRATDTVVATSIGTPSSVDMSLAQDLAITGQLGLGSETLTLEGYEVWLLP